ncbi:hypothetical protein [Halobacillus naozhouensis]|uniref:MORN repeat-containing protein n=1 Tax=Halobacillus naozhouensis TaxID=554880 RepID=A0ABY8IUE2_9BACI|nr:hypothetical protein [Halobacillus naozhouensis]WFT73738.1 hypothetical protein P9989_15365 [Halobacillus naozhouensis]
MTEVQSLIRRDAKRQLLTGSAFLIGMIVFVTSIFFVGGGSAALGIFYSIFFSAIGLALLKSGWKDSVKAKQSLQFVQDSSCQTFTRFPQRMYIGHKASSIFHARLYDMDGDVYSEIKQEPYGNRVIGAVASFYAGGWLTPASYQMIGEQGETSYKIDKKGGTYWRGYVQHPNGNYVAYTELKRNKKSSKSTFYYIEKANVHWKAEGDTHIGHYKVTDEEGESVGCGKAGCRSD